VIDWIDRGGRGGCKWLYNFVLILKKPIKKVERKPATPMDSTDTIGEMAPQAPIIMGVSTDGGLLAGRTALYRQCVQTGATLTFFTLGKASAADMVIRRNMLLFYDERLRSTPDSRLVAFGSLAGIRIDLPSTVTRKGVTYPVVLMHENQRLLVQRGDGTAADLTEDEKDEILEEAVVATCRKYIRLGGVALGHRNHGDNSEDASGVAMFIGGRISIHNRTFKDTFMNQRLFVRWPKYRNTDPTNGDHSPYDGTDYTGDRYRPMLGVMQPAADVTSRLFERERGDGFNDIADLLRNFMLEVSTRYANELRILNSIISVIGNANTPDQVITARQSALLEEMNLAHADTSRIVGNLVSNLEFARRKKPARLMFERLMKEKVFNAHDDLRAYTALIDELDLAHEDPWTSYEAVVMDITGSREGTTASVKAGITQKDVLLAATTLQKEMSSRVVEALQLLRSFLSLFDEPVPSDEAFASEYVVFKVVQGGPLDELMSVIFL